VLAFIQTERAPVLFQIHPGSCLSLHVRRNRAAIEIVFTSSEDCWQLKKGETTTIEFLAYTPGTYTFKCCHTRGLGHRGMKGQIIVEK